MISVAVANGRRELAREKGWRGREKEEKCAHTFTSTAPYPPAAGMAARKPCREPSEKGEMREKGGTGGRGELINLLRGSCAPYSGSTG